MKKKNTGRVDRRCESIEEGTRQNKKSKVVASVWGQEFIKFLAAKSGFA